MSKFIKFFQELSKKDVRIAGGKGASLGEMFHLFFRRTPPRAEPFGDFKNCKLGGQARAYNPIPSGFVITAAAFDRFLRETDLIAEIEAWIHRVNYKDINSVDRSSNTIRDLIHDARMPQDLQDEILRAYQRLQKFPPLRVRGGKEGLRAVHNSPSPSYLKRGGWDTLVAVRSSATAEDSSQASWAGELESYLNTTEKILLGRVKDCWSSLFTPRAIVYRNEKGMHKTYVSVAVVVQKMVQSEIAGVCFTVHPVTKHKHQMIIEACWGLGEALVGGEITPDSYVIDKRDWSLMDVAVSEQGKMRTRKNGGGVQLVAVGKLKSRQKLNGKQIVELAKLCGKIEKHYKFPCDIEWALEKGKFYIVQSRPITTL